MPASPARTAAFDILLRVERDTAYADELLHSDLLAPLSVADRGLCTEVVMGVLRWRARLDFAITKLASRPVEKLDLEVLIALRMAIYQIGWLERVPSRAAVNESVELVKRARKTSAVPFVNAILRKVSHTPMPVAHLQNVSDLAVELSHPEWLVDRWNTAFGFDAAQQICNFDQQVPQTAIRIVDPAAEQELTETGIELAPGRILSSARNVVQGDITRAPACGSGRIHIQDEGSQLVALLVGTGKRLLDCCAAPGGKTMVLAERNPDAQITAVELHDHRTRILRKRITAANIQIITADILEFPRGEYDRVLADVPCSGTGTLARNPEIKWKLRESDLGDFRTRQAGILRAALAQLVPGGRAVYSTCSLEHEECEDVVNEVLLDTGDFVIVPAQNQLEQLQESGELILDPASLVRGPYLRTLPGVQQCDGFFAAIVERTS